MCSTPPVPESWRYSDAKNPLREPNLCRRGTAQKFRPEVSLTPQSVSAYSANRFTGRGNYRRSERFNGESNVGWDRRAGGNRRGVEMGNSHFPDCASSTSRGTSKLHPGARLGTSGGSAVASFSLAVDPARPIGPTAVGVTSVSGDLPGPSRRRGGAPVGRRPVSTSAWPRRVALPAPLVRNPLVVNRQEVGS